MRDNSETEIEKLIEKWIDYHKNDIDPPAPVLPLAVLLKVDSNLIDRLKEELRSA